MSSPIANFKRNIAAIESIESIYLFMSSQVKALDLSEILRAQFVLLVSAVDAYVHDKVNEGVIKIFEGAKPQNNDYKKKLAIPLEVVHQLLAAPDSSIRKTILDSELRKLTNKHTYQSPSNIEKALQLIDIKNLWKRISVETGGRKSEDISTQLGLIVYRRNKIAHESDINPITNEKNIIDEQTVKDAKVFLCEMVFAIEKITA